ncbi:glycosyl transferase family 1 [Streptosporangium jomthongense]|uniref:Glycosyltransferase n=1 Tax=Marinobacter aromaticivorans TaxID=1494078 RepID=A0ABW2IS26_9GAMM|nr:glycosyltransferase [Marinobacter aromaticivorans]GGE57829.1 glycosyl transferase family 1 [Streptosporangium jomthongense]
MKILHFISSPAAGGAETYVRDLSIQMRRKGHDVHVVFLQSAEESGRDLEFEKLFLESLSAESISYSFVGKAARRKPWLGGLRLRSEAKTFRPDIIHCHLYYALLFSFFLFKLPVVYTHHSFKLGLPKFFYLLFDFKVSEYIAICTACKALLQGGSRRITQINNAVSRDRIITQAVVVNPAVCDVTCLFVGSLREPKNLPLLLTAFGELKCPNVRLLIAGEGPEKAELQRLADSLGITGRLTFLGNVSNIGEVLAKSDVFLMSSAWEGLPISLIEATLTGLPVVVTNVGGCAEVVHQCANGFVVDDLTVGSYAAALKKMVEDAELRAFFSRNALSFSSVYEIDEAVEQHLELYQRVRNL